MLIKNFTQVFSLAKSIGSPDNDGTISLTKDLFLEGMEFLPENVQDLNEPNNWNNRTSNLVSTLYGLFKQIDHSYSQLSSVRNVLEGKIKQIEGILLHAAKDLDSSENKNYAYLNKRYTSTDINLFSKIINTPKCILDPKELVITSPLNTSVSLNKGEGYFGGKITLERWTGNISHSDPSNVTDSSVYTSWNTEILSKAPIKTSVSGDPWVLESFSDKALILLTLDLNRPTTFNSIQLNTLFPVTLEKVSWDNSQVPQCVANSTLGSGASWTATNFAISGGVASLSGSKASLSQTIDLLSSAVQGSFSASPQDLTGTRAKVKILSKGSLLSPYKVNFVWKDGTGIVLREYSKKLEVTGGWSEIEIIDYVPKEAEDLDLSISYDPTPTSQESLEIATVECWIGESSYLYGKEVQGTKTINLPHSITTNRVSIILSRELGDLKFYTPPKIIQPGVITPSFFREDIKNTLKEGSYLSYPFSLQEIDFFYNQYVPVSGFFTPEIRPDKEIRTVNYNIEGDNLSLAGISSTIYPIKDDINIFRTINGSSGSFRLITTEEEERGWFGVDGEDVLIVKPQRVTEEFDGTDLFGKVKLEFSPHLSKIKLGDIRSWLDLRYVYKINFDPNCKKYVGLKTASLTNLTDLQTKGIQAVELTEADLEVSTGYLPVEVWVETPTFSAVPDTVGAPNSYDFDVVLDEELVNISYEVSKTIKKSTKISFEEWKASTILRSYLGLSSYRDLITKNLNSESLELTIKRAEEGGLLGGLIDLIQNDFSKISSQTSGEDSKDTFVASQVAFKTQYFPIKDGDDSIQVTLLNNTTVTSRILEPGEYEVINSLGIVKLTLNSIPSDYSVKASYRPVNELSKFINTNWFKVEDGSFTNSNIKLPLTRNITDYEMETDRPFKPFNLDRASSDYYPILEYKVSKSGEITFSREFSNLGGSNAKIRVSYDSLKQKINCKVILNSEDLPPKINTVRFGLE